MTERAVTNSTCLIALERIGRLGVLPQVFSAVIAPPAVQTELGNPVDWLDVRTIEDPRVVAALRTQLDEGEAQTIALAMELAEIFVILDDKKARRIAQQIGLNVIGTVGVLLRAKRSGAIQTLRPALADLREAGFHMTAICPGRRYVLPVKSLPSKAQSVLSRSMERAQTSWGNAKIRYSPDTDVLKSLTEARWFSGSPDDPGSSCP